MRILPVVPVVLPFLTAAVLLGLRGAIARRVGTLLAIGTASATAAACLALLHYSVAQTVVYWFGGWAPRGGFALGIEFAIDPMGAGMASLIAVLGVAALVFSARYFDTIGMLYPALMLIFIGAMCGFSLTGDLFNLFVFFELMSVAAFALCGYKSEDPETVEGAWNFALINSIGAFFIMTGIAFVYARTGALNMAQIGEALRARPAGPMVVTAFTFIAGGLMIKAAMVPFHFWLADAHAVAPTPVCVLFSGVMVELALYGIARVYWAMFAGAVSPGPGLRFVLLGFAATTAVLGAAMSFGQRNLKRMLAFSTISHSGIIAAGIALLTPKALAGAALYTLGHGVTKSALFLASGIILHRLGDVDEFKLHGRGRPIPIAGGVLIVGAAALAGFPLSGTHRGEALMLGSGREVGIDWLEWIAAGSAVLTSAAVLRFVGRVFFGWGPAYPLGGQAPTKEAQETHGGHDRTPMAMYVPAIALALTGILLGLAPGLTAGAWHAASRFESSGSRAEGFALFPDAMRGFSILAGAVMLALLSTFSLPVRKALAGFGRIFGFVRELHNGHAGDYTAWLTFGIATLGIALLVAAR